MNEQCGCKCYDCDGSLITLCPLHAQAEELREALEKAKADILHFKKTGKMWLYPTLEAIDSALAKSTPDRVDK